MKILEGRKILIADDDEYNIYALEAALEEYGMNIVTARNGAEAVSLLAASPDFDMALMDIMMPEMDGYEAIRRIRAMETYARIPIIALTAKAMKGDEELCLQAGATGYLPKPIDVERLVRMMAEQVQP